MIERFRSRRTAWPLVTLLAVIAVVALAPRLGFTTGTPAPLWTDRLPGAPPAPVQTPAWTSLARTLTPAVVNVSTTRVQEGPDPFALFFGPLLPQQAPRRTVRSLGSGFVINPNGYVVTNNHVVDGASEILVKLWDGRELGARLAGRDPRTDLALLKIDASGLPVIPLGDSDQLQVGEPVMAIGNPFGLGQTVTTGIVSATGRVIGEGPYDDFIQTDASINPGNSGGPLINARGQAVGINTAIYTQGGGSVGVGFAIPINLAKPVVAQLADTGHVVRGWLGVAIQPVTPDLAKSLGLPDATGALIASVVEDSPAARAGVKAGDVVTRYGDRAIARSEQLPRVVADTPVGRQVPLTVVRAGKTLTLSATIARLEEPERRAAADGAPGATLGLAAQTLTPSLARELGIPDTRGVLVRGVEDGGRAERAGLAPGDVIVEIDHQPVGDVAALKRALQRHGHGRPLLVLVHRNGSSLFLAVAS